MQDSTLIGLDVYKATILVAVARGERGGDRVKADRRDAVMLAKLHRAGELTSVWVPDAAHEAMHDLVWARATAVRVLGKARQHLQGFLLRHPRQSGSLNHAGRTLSSSSMGPDPKGSSRLAASQHRLHDARGPCQRRARPLAGGCINERLVPNRPFERDAAPGLTSPDRTFKPSTADDRCLFFQHLSVIHSRCSIRHDARTPNESTALAASYQIAFRWTSDGCTL